MCIFNPYSGYTVLHSIAGRLKPVWEFFAERIRLKNEVELIRGNLKLQDEKKKRKSSSNEEDEDDYEINVVTRSVEKF